MHRTTPSGARRIWAKTPCSMVKRDEARSRSFRASAVARMYSTVRSNSFSESACDLPTSHISRRTTSARRATMAAAKASTWRMRPATGRVGQAPRPWS